jgi:hypothetical protein
MRRTRSTIKKSQRGSGNEIQSSNASPLAESETASVPESPFREMVRR